MKHQNRLSISFVWNVSRSMSRTFYAICLSRIIFVVCFVWSLTIYAFKTSVDLDGSKSCPTSSKKNQEKRKEANRQIEEKKNREDKKKKAWNRRRRKDQSIAENEGMLFLLLVTFKDENEWKLIKVLGKRIFRRSLDRKEYYSQESKGYHKEKRREAICDLFCPKNMTSTMNLETMREFRSVMSCFQSFEFDFLV